MAHETTLRYVPYNQDKRLEHIQKLANWLDNKWQIPGTRYRVGFDAILGLIPGIGDTLSVAISSWIIYEAHQMGAPHHLKLRMMWNMFIDWLIGLIPLLGDILDIGWKSNQKNAALLHEFHKNSERF